MQDQRRILLIDPKFQLKFCLFVTLAMMVTILPYPWILYDIFEHVTKIVAPYSNEKAETFRDMQTQMLFVIFSIHLMILSLFVCFSVFVSHKIAGPIYKIRKHLKDIKDKRVFKELNLRRGDYFQDLAEQCNKTFKSLEENYQNDLLYLNEVTTYIENLADSVPEDKKLVLGEINKKLAEIQNRYAS